MISLVSSNDCNSSLYYCNTGQKIDVAVFCIKKKILLPFVEIYTDLCYNEFAKQTQ